MAATVKQRCCMGGWESYQISEDIETANDFVIVERWASLEAQYRHFRTPEFRRADGPPR
jgi:quinol monooxygenase YgiN